MDNIKAAVAGIFPPIPAPFDENGALKPKGLERNLSRWNEEPLAGYVVMGSNGESVHLIDEEKTQLVRWVKQWASPDRKIIVGSGMQSTIGTIELTKKLANAGGDTALIITPSYYKNQMTEQALLNHFCSVADDSPIPIMIYNVPAYTGLDMPSRVILELAQHPNIVGLKESSGHMGKAALIMESAPDDFCFLTGTANSFLGALTLGARGGIMALANIAARALHAIQLAVHSQDLDRAQEIQRRLVPANLAITQEFGIPGLKAALDMQGSFGGAPRAPLSLLSKDDRATLRKTLKSADLL